MDNLTLIIEFLHFINKIFLNLTLFAFNLYKTFDFGINFIDHDYLTMNNKFSKITNKGFSISQLKLV